MSKIFYNLDNITVAEECLKITGWAFSDTHPNIDIKVKNSNSFLLKCMLRDDVQTSFASYPYALKSGFLLEINLNSLEENITIIFSDVESDECLAINTKPYTKSKHKRLPGLASKKTIIDPYRMKITENTSYRIENIWLDNINHVLRLTGWAFEKNSADIVRLISPSGEIIRTSRHDVKEYYPSSCPDAMCGFEIKLSSESNSQEFLTLCIGREDPYIIHVSLGALEKDLKTNNIVEGQEKKNLFSQYLSHHKNVMKYGEFGAKLKEREYQIFLEESNLNRSPYNYQEICIPQKWITLQKQAPSIGIIIPIRNTTQIKKKLEFLLETIAEQSYTNFEVIFCGSIEDLTCIGEVALPRKDVIVDHTDSKAEMIWTAISDIDLEYFTVVEQEDFLDKHYLFTFVEMINLHPECLFYYADYDVFDGEAPLFPVKRGRHFSLENADKILISTCAKISAVKNAMDSSKMIQLIRGLAPEKVIHIPKIAYHVSASKNQWIGEKSRIIAFYLPQFHENDENNKWWGQGFTEWVNVKRAYPMFKGHNQPRIPADLGYYNLVEDQTIQYKQIALATQHDIFGFCFYYYWFEGKRLLRKPLDQYLEKKDLNLPFCICWANETWSRRWDGAEKEILMQQVHNEKTDKAFIYDVIPMLKDERYIKIDGKPLLLIYRIELFPKPSKTIAMWKRICQKEGVGDIHVALVQSFGMVDHRIYGADSSVEFPPHKIVGGTINDQVLSEEQKKEYTGNIYSYREIVENQMLVQKRDYMLWPGSMLGWDNTARRLKAANVFHEFTPELYRKWLIKNHTYTQLYNSEPYMFVNAWNEWAEGTYLEPDQTYGHTLLEISQEIVNYK